MNSNPDSWSAFCLFVFSSDLWFVDFLIPDIKNVLGHQIGSRVLQFPCRLLQSQRDAAVRASAHETLQKVGVFPPTILQSPHPSLHPPHPSLQTTRVDQLRCGADERPSLLWDDRTEKAGHKQYDFNIVHLNKTHVI